jgi:phosphate transport system protein
MSNPLQSEIKELRQGLLHIGSLVESSTQLAMAALMKDKDKLAERVIEQDIEIDHLEVELEEACLKVLALHQPVATDLRTVTTIMKINSDLERVGDLAVNIAERVLEVETTMFPEILEDLTSMGTMAREMVKLSLDSFVELDVALAFEVWKTDDVIDEKMNVLFNILEKKIHQDLANMTKYTRFMSIARYLERMGDQATNIAEDVVYMVEGKIFRHKMQLVDVAKYRRDYLA